MSTLIALIFVIAIAATFIVGALFGSAYRDHVRERNDEMKQISDEIEKGKEAYFKVLERLETLEILIKK